MGICGEPQNSGSQKSAQESSKGKNEIKIVKNKEKTKEEMLQAKRAQKNRLSTQLQAIVDGNMQNDRKFQQIKNKAEFEKYFQTVKEIGRGNFGTVKLMKWKKHDDFQCAVKIVNKKRLATAGTYECMRQELETLMKSDQCNITPILQLMEDDKSIYIVTEFMEDGDLEKFFVSQGLNLSALIVQHIIKQLVTCLKYLHSQLDIVHRDIKPANVLIEDKERVDQHRMDIKLTDFGFAGQSKDTRVSMQQNIGTPDYMAPELFRSQYVDGSGKKIGKNVDVWAIGVMTFQLLSLNAMPFKKADDKNVDQDELKRRICEEEPFWEDFVGSDLAKDFVSKCLEKDWTKRIDSTRLNEHEWLTQKEYSVAPQQVANEAKKAIIEFQKLNLFEKQMRHLLADITAKLKSEEMKNIRRMNRKMDDNKDSKINREEFKKYMRESSGEFDDEKLDELFGAIDINNDNSISWSEFVACTMKEDLMKKEENLKSVFKLLDKDQDGYIDQQEMTQGFGSCNLNYQDMEQVQAEFIKNFDQDGDQRVSYEEFLTAMTKTAQSTAENLIDNQSEESSELDIGL